MILEVRELDDGVRVDGPTGEIGLDLEPVDGERAVHIGKPGEGSGPDMCEVTGNTYHHKDKIKKLPYGDDGSKWTGEVWEVNVNKSAELCAVLKIAAVGVSIHAKAVVEDRSWSRLRKSIDIDDGRDEDSELRLMAGPESPMEGVSRSWAEDAAEVGCFESAEAFADKFGLNIVEDEEAKEIVEGDEDDKGNNPFSSE